MPPPSPSALADPARIETLRGTGLLDGLPEEAFDRLTRLATRLVGAPVALLSLVDTDRQVFKSAVGLPEPWATSRETPLSHSFCQHVVASGSPFVVEDARAHPLVQDNAAIDDLGVEAYAGIPLTTEDGHVLGSLCAIDHRPGAWAPQDLEALRDLAAMAMSEIALRRTIRNHRLLTEYASDMISTHSAEGLYRYASPAARALLGIEPAELVGRQAYERFHPDDVPAIETSHAAALADASQVWTTQYRIRRDDGDYVWVETRGQATPHGDTGPEIVAVTRDISEQKAVEEALAVEREHFRMLTEAIPQQVWTALPDGTLDYVSDRLAAFFGQSRETVLGRGWVDVLHPEDVAPTLERWTHSLATGEPYQVEFRIRDTEGRYHWHLARALPFRNAAGDITRWFGTNTDITDRKDLEAALETETARLETLLESLQQAQHQLVQQEKMASLGRVTAGIAHEIQNPLNFVINFGVLAASLTEEVRDSLPADDESALEAIDHLAVNVRRVIHHGQRADRIARSMLSLARNAPRTLEPTDLNALVDEHLALARDAHDQVIPPGLTVETDYDAGVGTLPLHAEGVGRMTINLVANAINALNDRAQMEGPAFRPRLRVATRRTDSGVEVVVEDNGTGITDEVLPHIFEPFYTTKPPGQGTGLGLSLSHETVVQGHGGDLSVRTQAGEGAAFTATFPTSPRAEASGGTGGTPQAERDPEVAG